MNIFTMIRHGDESGVSGTGRVLDGVVFHNGKVVICWRTDIDGSRHGASSLGIYDSWEDFEFIHIDSHPKNQTRIVWDEDLVTGLYDEEISEPVTKPREMTIRESVDQFLRLPNHVQANLLHSLELIDPNVYTIGIPVAKEAFALAKQQDRVETLLKRISDLSREKEDK